MQIWKDRIITAILVAIVATPSMAAWQLWQENQHLARYAEEVENANQEIYAELEELRR